MPDRLPRLLAVRLLAAALLLALPGVAHATTTSSTAHVVSLSLGVPLPLSVYGYEPEAGGQSGYRFIGHATLTYAARPWAGAPLYLGAWLGGGAIGATEQSLEGWTYLVSGGPLALGRVVLGALGGRAVTLELGGGVGLLCSGVHVDANMYKDTEAVGLRLQGGLGVDVADGLALTLNAAVEMYGAPLRRAVWYNEALGSSNYLLLGLGLTWALPGADR